MLSELCFQAVEFAHKYADFIIVPFAHRHFDPREHAFAGPFDDVNKQFQPADHIPVDEKERYDAAQKEKQKEYDHGDL